MHGDDAIQGRYLWHGPRLWAASAVLGAGAGWLLSRAAPMPVGANGAPEIPLWLVAPFGVLLLSIAVVPLASARWWHRHFPDVSFFLGALVAAYYVIAVKGPSAMGSLSLGQEKVAHAGLEFYSFIALVGGLFVVAGGVLIEFKGRGGPVFNAVILLIGAVLANVVGTTGASMLLVRPFMRANEGRLHPLHIVLFIFIVSNCGGCLTPIGDPPLYLGYIKGVPFLWTLEHLWHDWLVTVGGLLVVFVVIDLWVEKRVKATREREGLPELAPAAVFPVPRIAGGVGIVCLVLMIAGVFVDPLLHKVAPHLPHLPYGATFQVLVAGASYMLAPRKILVANDFSFFPVKEVGLLFLGIFMTMIPALGYLAANGGKLGVDNPTAFYFATGALSAMLDNAPTYLNFLQVAVPGELTRESIGVLISTPEGVRDLMGISTGAVFFGAMTYIGNGPNFMVRTIAESHGVRMPSFFGYLAWALVLLLPVLVVQWLLFIR